MELRNRLIKSIDTTFDEREEITSEIIVDAILEDIPELYEYDFLAGVSGSCPNTIKNKESCGDCEYKNYH